jgi:hypothetical protein
VLRRHFGYSYADNLITFEEELHKIGLQVMFDLGYDQFDSFKKVFVESMRRNTTDEAWP